METPPASSDLEAAVPAGSAAKKVEVADEEEDPRRLHWSLVRKIYGILSLQFLLTAAVAATAFFFAGPIQSFFADGPTAAVWPTFIAILVSPLIVMFPMLEDSEKNPRNLVLLRLFTLCCSFSTAVPVFAFTTVDTVVLQVTILIVLGLILLAIWAAKSGYNYDSDCIALLSTSIAMPLMYIIIMIPCFPLKMLGITICGFLGALVFSSAYVISDAVDDHRHN